MVGDPSDPDQPCQCLLPEADAAVEVGSRNLGASAFHAAQKSQVWKHPTGRRTPTLRNRAEHLALGSEGSLRSSGMLECAPATPSVRVQQKRESRAREENTRGK